MSWNVTGHGSKHALIGAVEKYFEPFIKEPLETAEYVGAKAALRALLDSAPDHDLYSLESGGSVYVSAGPGKRQVFFGTKIELKSINRID